MYTHRAGLSVKASGSKKSQQFHESKCKDRKNIKICIWSTWKKVKAWPKLYLNNYIQQDVSLIPGISTNMVYDTIAGLLVMPVTLNSLKCR